MVFIYSVIWFRFYVPVSIGFDKISKFFSFFAISTNESKKSVDSKCRRFAQELPLMTFSKFCLPNVAAACETRQWRLNAVRGHS